MVRLEIVGDSGDLTEFALLLTVIKKVKLVNNLMLQKLNLFKNMLELMTKTVTLISTITQSDKEIIDDSQNFQDQEPSNYRLINVTRDLQEAINCHSIYGDDECSEKFCA